MKVASLVSVLLKNNDRVIVPGLGAFMPRQYSGSRASSSVKRKEDVMFSAFLTANDGFLVNKLAEDENISVDEAKQKVNLFVAFCKEELSTGKRVYFDHLGWLFHDSNNRIQFEEMDRLDAFQQEIEQEKKSAAKIKEIENKVNKHRLEKKTQSSINELVSPTNTPAPKTTSATSAKKTAEHNSISTQKTTTNTPISKVKEEKKLSNHIADNKLKSSVPPKQKKVDTEKSNIQKSNNYSKSNSIGNSSGNPPEEPVDNQKQENNMESNFNEELEQKKSNAPLIISILAAVVIVAGGVFYFMSDSASGEDEQVVSEESVDDWLSDSSDESDLTASLSNETTTLEENTSPSKKVDAKDASAKVVTSADSKPEESVAVKETASVTSPAPEKKQVVESAKPVKAVEKKFANPSQSNGNYFIIAASVKNNNQAEKIAAKLKTKGFNPFIVPRNSDGNIRVSYGRWASKSVAAQELKTIRSQENGDAWLVKLNVN
ncbi:MAG: SPOR domain-containing protein [Bacteroidales bacterium]